MLFKKINNFLLSLFVFSLPFTAFSVFQIGEKDIIFSWFLVFLLGLLNIKRFKKIDKRLTFLLFILFLWWIFLFLSVVKTSFLNEDIYQKEFTQLFNILIMMIHLPILYVVFRNKKFSEIKKIINVLLFSTFLLVFYSFYQYFSYFVNFLPKVDFFRNATIYGIYRGSGMGGWSGTYRTCSVAPEPTFWASYLLIPISFLIPYLFSFRKFWIKKILFLLFFLSLVLTFGRSGWIGFALMLLIVPLVLKISPKLKFCYFMITLILITFTFGGIIGNYLKIPIFSDSSFAQRLYAQLSAFEIFSTNPILGVGFGNFQNFAENYFISKPYFSFLVTHNFYLRILAETGMLGFLIFLLFLGFLFREALRGKLMTKQIKNKEIERFVQGLELSFFSILIVWVFGSGYNFSYIWFIFALILVSPQILFETIKQYENSN